MGKPFKKELSFLKDTLLWADSLDVSKLHSFFETQKYLPLLAVGSGGSFSACHYAVLLYENFNTMAKAITPLDYIYSTHLIDDSKSLFISASGKNNDILISVKKSVAYNAPLLANLSVKSTNPLQKEIDNFEHGMSCNYELPTGKDGFLATNSLVAFFAILYRAFCIKSEIGLLANSTAFHCASNSMDSYLNDVKNRMNFTVLYGGWGLPVAYDIESKFTEAALGAVQLTDYRNFGHGRHHWFDKHRESSSIIAIVTPKEKLIAEKTLALIPSDIPRIIIESGFNGSLASIDLLIKSFYLVGSIGNLRNIDPGRPGVPDFGRQLYHLKYASFYKNSKPCNNDKNLFIVRKAHVNSIDRLSGYEENKWTQAYDRFLKKISNTFFTGLILDYDGTICSTANRFEECLESGIKKFIENFLKNNIKVGIVTGRGGSIKSLLRNSIENKYWNNVYVGYYNGAELGTLDDESIPNSELPIDSRLKELYDSFFADFIIQESDFEKIELKSLQLTIRAKNGRIYDFAKSALQNLILKKDLSANICIIESSHSLDIIVRPNVSKLNIIKRYFSNERCLCIGDKGLAPGNDFELLSHGYSLSVDEVSYDPDSCWNLSPNGFKNIKAMYYYMSKFVVNKDGFKVNF